MRASQNIVLIGMPGVGKSTIGVLLAKAVSRDFIDTDVYIQAIERRRLQDIIDEEGVDAFCALEGRYILGLACSGSVVATGGSVVYSERAMRHLQSLGILVHLDLPLEAIRGRLTNLGARGVAMGPGQTIEALFRERQPLYRRYADVTVETSGLAHEGVVERLMQELGLEGEIKERGPNELL